MDSGGHTRPVRVGAARLAQSRAEFTTARISQVGLPEESLSPGQTACTGLLYVKNSEAAERTRLTVPLTSTICSLRGGRGFKRRRPGLGCSGECRHRFGGR